MLTIYLRSEFKGVKRAQFHLVSVRGVYIKIRHDFMILSMRPHMIHDAASFNVYIPAAAP